MTYCLKPACPQPKNPVNTQVCEACGSTLWLRNRYRINRALGLGSSGTTYLANIMTLPGEPFCVIKQLRPNANAPQLIEMARELFERESITLDRIGNHPQIPSLLDYFEDNQQFYLVQEYVAGYTLKQEVRRNGLFSEAGVKQFLSEVLPLLRYIHSQKVIHRNIKPASLMRREQDRKLVMINFWKLFTSGFPLPEHSMAMIDFGKLETSGFAPPEQMIMRPVYASDFYAVGVTCIYLLTGKLPQDIEYNLSTGEMMWQQYVNISDYFALVLKKLLEPSIHHRYQSIDDILRAMDMEPFLRYLAEHLADLNTGEPRTSSGAGSMAEVIRARRALLKNATR
jgi:serine/threonine protein kinase, bacterial